MKKLVGMTAIIGAMCFVAGCEADGTGVEMSAISANLGGQCVKLKGHMKNPYFKAKNCRTKFDWRCVCDNVQLDDLCVGEWVFELDGKEYEKDSDCKVPYDNISCTFVNELISTPYEYCDPVQPVYDHDYTKVKETIENKKQHNCIRCTEKAGIKEVDVENCIDNNGDGRPEACNSGPDACYPADARCQGDSQCCSGACVDYYCKLQCVDNSYKCDSDGDCCDGYCDKTSYKCAPRPPTTCHYDSDCRDGKKCVDYKCEAPCHSDYDCDYGRVCDMTKYVCKDAPTPR